MGFRQTIADVFRSSSAELNLIKQKKLTFVLLLSRLSDSFRFGLEFPYARLPFAFGDVARRSS